MSNLGLSICVSGYDTENIKQALSRTENGKLDFWSLISGLFTVMPKGLCKLLEEMVKTEYGIELSLDKLYVGTVNQWKGAIIL